MINNISSVKEGETLIIKQKQVILINSYVEVGVAINLSGFPNLLFLSIMKILHTIAEDSLYCISYLHIVSGHMKS